MVLDGGTSRAILSAVHATTVGHSDEQIGSTTKLDSHANMVVVGSQATIISQSGSFAEVWAFAKDCKTLDQIAVVDVAFVYNCTSLARHIYS